MGLQTVTAPKGNGAWDLGRRAVGARVKLRSGAAGAQPLWVTTTSQAAAASGVRTRSWPMMTRLRNGAAGVNLRKQAHHGRDEGDDEASMGPQG